MKTTFISLILMLGASSMAGAKEDPPPLFHPRMIEAAKQREKCPSVEQAHRQAYGQLQLAIQLVNASKGKAQSNAREAAMSVLERYQTARRTYVSMNVICSFPAPPAEPQIP